MAGFLDLYDSSFDDVYRYVYFKVGNKWDTDDLVSDIFSKAVQKWSTVRGDRRAWLFTVSRNTVTDFYRRRGREVPTAAVTENSSAAATDLAEQSLALECLREALGTLSQEQRELVSLRYFAGLRHNQIARTLEVSEGSIKMRVHRLLGQIKELVEKCLIE